MAKKKPAKKTKKKKARSRPVPARRAAGKEAIARVDAAIDESAPDVKLVEKTLELIQQHRQHEAAGRLEIGLHLLATYYGGDADRVSAKSPRKPFSFGLLAE